MNSSMPAPKLITQLLKFILRSLSLPWLIVLLCQIAITPVTGIQLPDLYWNTTNTRFLSAPFVISAWMKDRINIICPSYRGNKDRVPNPDDLEYHVIYKVSKWGYENCVADDTAKVMLRCEKPVTGTRPLSMTFREWSPNPGALEFHPGNVYYFISTSDGTKDTLRATKGGLCASNNMRLQIEVHGYRKRKQKTYGYAVPNAVVSSNPKSLFPSGSQGSSGATANNGNFGEYQGVISSSSLHAHSQGSASNSRTNPRDRLSSKNNNYPKNGYKSELFPHNSGQTIRHHPTGQQDMSSKSLLSDSPLLNLGKPGGSSKRTGPNSRRAAAQEIAALQQIEVEIGYEKEHAGTSPQSLNTAARLHFPLTFLSYSPDLHILHGSTEISEQPVTMLNNNFKWTRI